MKENQFVFTDLSTYDMKVAERFYSNVFGWHYQGSDTYRVALADGEEVSGLYETPQKFKDMNMPSFWMPYIQVKNVKATVDKAKALQGIVELVDEKQAVGKIALIRDPLGAGFTVYEGSQLNARFDHKPNAFVWSELIISDFSKIQAFYEGLFDWSFKAVSDHRFYIHSKKRQRIGAIQEVSNAIKGKMEYWTVFFGVADLSHTKANILAAGGSLVYEDESSMLLADPFGAVFSLAPILSGQSKKQRKASSKKTIKWKALLGLALITLSLLTNWYWIWGVFFALWVISDLRSGTTHMLEPISQQEQPVLYWIIVGMWTLLSFYSLIYYFSFV